MNRTMITRIFALLAVAAAMVAGGCVQQLVTTTPVHTEPMSELEKYDNRMFRGVVVLVAPDDKLEDLIAAYDGDEARFKRLHDLSFEQARARQFIILHWRKALGQKSSHAFLASRQWNLQPGDIVDMFPGAADFKNPKPPVEAHGLCWSVGFWHLCSADLDFGQVAKVPSQVLGVVCRADAPGCRYNSSPETTIGMGRHMINVAEYRGAEAESHQPIVSDVERNVYTFFGINACADCTEDDPSLADLAERNAAE